MAADMIYSLRNFIIMYFYVNINTIELNHKISYGYIFGEQFLGL
jgi:hypothetical protein